VTFRIEPRATQNTNQDIWQIWWRYGYQNVLILSTFCPLKGPPITLFQISNALNLRKMTGCYWNNIISSTKTKKLQKP
jgi:hypothetical protein